MKWLLLGFCLVLLGCDRSTTLTTAGGKSLTLAADDKRYIAVSYWASWCTSCKPEVTAMNQLSKQYSHKLIVLGVNFDGQRGQQLTAAMQQLHIHYPVVVSDLATTWHLPEPEVLPTTYLLSADHKLIKTFYGEKTAQELKAWLR